MSLLRFVGLWPLAATNTERIRKLFSSEGGQDSIENKEIRQSHTFATGRGCFCGVARALAFYKLSAVAPRFSLNASPVARTDVRKLTTTVTAKLKHNAINPAFTPMKGSRLVSTRKATIPMPVSNPEKTPGLVTLFE